MKTWFVPEMNYFVLRRESTFVRPNTGTTVIDSVSQSPELNASSNIWYPKDSIYERFVDGKLEIREETRISVISLNEPLSPEVFSIAGIDAIPVGAPVIRMGKDEVDEANAELQTWNGTEVVRGRYVPILENLPTENPRVNLRRWLVIANAVIAVGLVGVFLYRRMAAGRCR